MQQGQSQLHSFQVRRPQNNGYTLLYNGSIRIGLVSFYGFHPFNSKGHSISAYLPGLHRVLPGSLKTALKCTRPRQRFSL